MRHRLSGLLLTVAIGLAATATSLAHHSVPGQFDTTKPMTLKGVISKIDWINPHIYIRLDVKEPDGTTSTRTETIVPAATTN